MGQIRVQCPACKHAYELRGLPAPNSMLACEQCGNRFPFRLTKPGAEPPPAAATPSSPYSPAAAAARPLAPIIVPPTAAVAPPPMPNPQPPTPQPLAPVNVPPTSVVLDGKTLMLGGAGMLVGLAVLIVAIVGSMALLFSKMNPSPAVAASNAAGEASKATASQQATPTPNGGEEKKTTNQPIAVGSSAPPAIQKTAEQPNIAPAEAPDGPAPLGVLGFVTIVTPDQTLTDFVGAWVVGKRLWATHALGPARVDFLYPESAKYSVRTADGREFKVVRKIWHPKFAIDKFGKEKPTDEEFAERMAHAVVLLESDVDLPPRFQLGNRASCEAAFVKSAPLAASVLPIRASEIKEKLPMRTYNPKLANPRSVDGMPGYADLKDCNNDRNIDGFPIVDENGRAVALAAVIMDQKNKPLAFAAVSIERVRELLDASARP